jgi:hypothetical protein
MTSSQAIAFDDVHGFMSGVFAEDVHAKQAYSLDPGHRPRPVAVLVGAVCGGVAAVVAVAMDWTDFDADGQATIMPSLLTGHGRATPLAWLTVDKKTLKKRRNEYEYRVLVRLAEVLPAEMQVLIVADRGFGDKKLYRVLSEELKFDYVIRLRGNIQVTDAAGETRPAADWVGPSGRARVLRSAEVTAERYPSALWCAYRPRA